MSDISKCSGEGCYKKESCYRFTAESSEYWQAWLTPLAVGDECIMFWDNSNRKVKNES